MPGHRLARRPEPVRPPPAPYAAPGLLARPGRGPVALASLRGREGAMRALAVAQVRGAARLVLDATGPLFVVRGGSTGR